MWARGAVRNAGAEIESAVESIKRPFRLTRSLCSVKTVGSDFNGYSGKPLGVYLFAGVLLLLLTW